MMMTISALCRLCGSTAIVKYGRDETQPDRQRYKCGECNRYFNDLTNTIRTSSTAKYLDFMSIFYRRSGAAGTCQTDHQQHIFRQNRGRKGCTQYENDGGNEFTCCCPHLPKLQKKQHACQVIGVKYYLLVPFTSNLTIYIDHDYLKEEYGILHTGGVKMNNTVAISKFKATCLALIDSVNKTGQPLIITRRGAPIAQIIPPPLTKKKKGWLGSFRNSGSIKGDIISPVTNMKDWEVLDNEAAP